MISVKELISQLKVLTLIGAAEGDIHRIITDSRVAQKGDAFVAIRGTAGDGHDFIAQVIEQGVRVIICETIPAELVDSVLYIKISNTREVVLPLSLLTHGNPEKQLKLIGVTGTNGKTTVSTLIWQVLTRIGYSAALLGTVSKYFGKFKIESTLTTPGPVELAADLRHAVDAGCSHFIMEVSSHALAQQRVKGLSFDVAVFTNLTHDHLDYHGSVDAYASAKKILFDQLSESAIAVINADDPYAGKMIQNCVSDVWPLSFSDGDAFIHELSTNGTVIEVDGERIETPLIGRFNAYNVAQAYLVCRALGCNKDAVIDSLAEVTGAPGRMERVQAESEIELPKVFVDYAHTPDALRNILSTVQALKQDDERIITIFGCGGNRDAAKRPLMAEIAEAFSDEVVATSDNPRHENPDHILDDIMRGASDLSKWKRMADRPTAIKSTIVSCSVPSVVVVAGKGHEDYQEIKGVRYPMDDRILVIQSLAERLGAARRQEVH